MACHAEHAALVAMLKAAEHKDPQGRPGAHGHDGALADEGVGDGAVVDDGGRQDVAAADDRLVHVKYADGAVGLGQLQIDLIEVPQPRQLLRCRTRCSADHILRHSCPLHTVWA